MSARLEAQFRLKVLSRLRVSPGFTMAALDPRFEFRFEPGAPTAGNLNTAAGFPNLVVGATHFLSVASGGVNRAEPEIQEKNIWSHLGVIKKFFF